MHFHGLFSGYKGSLKDSGHAKNGRIIHNIGSYRGGFTTAVKIDDIKKVSSYVAKYMTKEMPKFRNKQRYWCSNDLKRPAKIINPLLTGELKELFKSVFRDSHKEIFETDIAVTQLDVDHMSNYGQRRYDDLRVADWF